MPHVLVGLGGLLSDPAVCVIKDGRLAAAIEQAKVSRQERLGTFPEEAFALALQMAQLDAAQVGCVAVARPFTAGPESVAQLALRARFPQSEIVVVEHHHAHAASAYYLSGFDESAVLSVDRAGDFRSAVLFRAIGNELTTVREMYFPDSLGDLYNRITALLGFEPRADEHKVQWLSAAGEPNFSEVMEKMLHASGLGWP
ncbi:MAG: hypothetical protein JO270_22550, partial [Acidobacteriaceae bacterium]|nr:hypothetical protein [Acidobacteriaceae bacterium]